MEKPRTGPLHVTVTAAWRDEMQRRQAAYAARRAQWTNAHLRGEQPEPPTETERRGERGTRTIYDRRQFRLDL